MDRCVAFAFSYVQRSPRTLEELEGELFGQLAAILQFAQSHDLTIERMFLATKTNRDNHFAHTAEFRAATRRAKELGAPLVLASLLELLSAIAPERIFEAANAVFEQGVEILDAALGRALSAGDLSATIEAAKRISRRRRGAIRAGIKKSKTVRDYNPANQIKAAKGATRAADARARKLRPVVEEIMRGAPKGSLGPTKLADELNIRGVLTVRGKQWSPTTARDLLRRLELQTAPSLKTSEGS